jgi:4-amino-4-deoxy-L-arabinose transferase-like glycosyltransferase
MPAIFEQQQISQKHPSGRQESGLRLGFAGAGGEPVAWGWLAGLVAAAIVLRAVALNQQLWFDEIMTLLDSARAPVWQIVTHYGGQNQHMLYSILAHGSIRMLGEQAWTLRLPAACFGVACIPALYFFGRLVTNNREALAACALMTVNYQHIWFSQNARGYTAMAFWTLLASIFFLRCANGGKRLDWAIYGITAALGVYTHLMMAFVVAGHLVVYLWMLASQARSGQRLSRRWLGLAYGFVLCGVVSALLYAPVIPGILSHTVGAGRDHVRYEWASPLWALAELGRGLHSTTAGGWLALGIGGAILLCGLLNYWKQGRFLAGLMILPGVMTAAGVLATSHNFWPRFFFFEIGFALLILARGAMVIGKFAARAFGRPEKFGLQMGAALIALLLLGSIVPLRAAYLSKQDYLGAMQFVEQQRQGSEQIATAGVVTTPYQRYYGRPWPRAETRQQLDELMNGEQGTWLLYAMPASIRSSQPELWADIDGKFTLVRKFGGTLGGGDIYVSRSRDFKGADEDGR